MAALHSPQAVLAATPASARSAFDNGTHRAATPAMHSYWSPQWLHGFSLLMAGHGCCVNESLMLCDHAYARARLREACAMADQRLQQMAVEMLTSLAPKSRAEAPTLPH